MDDTKSPKSAQAAKDENEEEFKEAAKNKDDSRAKKKRDGAAPKEAGAKKEHRNEKKPKAEATKRLEIPTLVTSSSPHVHGPENVSKIMWTVFVCLLPATAVGIYRFGMDAAIVLATCTGGSIVFEALIQKLAKKPLQVGDGSAALTGLLLGLNLPAGCPIYVCLMGSAVAVGIAKAVFGGLGHNPFNPALTARVFLLIAFPVALTTWPLTRQQVQKSPPKQYFGAKTTWKDKAGRVLEQNRKNEVKVDTVTGATPLPAVKNHYKQGTLSLVKHTDLLWGNQPGCIGETSALALLLGGLVLLLLGYISWYIPLTYLLTVAVIAAVTQGVDPDRFAGPMFHLLAGGVMIGAFFMATDYVTSPVYPKGKLLFGVGLGVLTMIIRLWGGYPEGVSFAILLMNAVTPLIDRVTRPKKYGLKRWAASQ